MKIAGIILIFMQVFSLFGGLPTPPGNPMNALSYYFGYFLPGIIGVILLVKGLNAKKDSSEDES